MQLPFNGNTLIFFYTQKFNQQSTETDRIQAYAGMRGL